MYEQILFQTKKYFLLLNLSIFIIPHYKRDRIKI